MKEFLIIANPVSGSRSAPGVAARVLELLRARGVSAELETTRARGDARRLAAEAARAGVRVVVGCGGDGTLQEIASAIEGTPAALGILPRGRCNDFAHALDLHRTDTPERQAEILLAGRARAVDLGAIGEHRFLTVATLGFDSEVSRFVETRRLWVKGTPAYIYGVLRVLATFRPPLLRLRGDFGVIEGRFLLAATGNAPCYGGAMRIAPGARLDDGRFQVCLVDAVPTLTVLRMLQRVMSGTHAAHPAVRLLDTSFLEVETPEGPLWICADGESLCQTPCRTEARAGTLRVIVP